MTTAILLDAIYGFDDSDSKSLKSSLYHYAKSLSENSIQGKRFGVLKKLMKDDSLYLNATHELKKLGAEIVEFEEPEVDLPDFLRLLNLDMKKDLPFYLERYAAKDIEVHSVQDVIAFNKNDSVNKMPYGQKLFYGIVEDEATDDEFSRIKATLHKNGKQFFDQPFEIHKLDAFLSINNYHAGYAAVAEYPAITVPMGYTQKGQPKGLTFIARPLEEKELLNWAYQYEKATQLRVAPKEYMK